MKHWKRLKLLKKQSCTKYKTNNTHQVQSLQHTYTYRLHQPSYFPKWRNYFSLSLSQGCFTTEGRVIGDHITVTCSATYKSNLGDNVGRTYTIPFLSNVSNCRQEHTSTNKYLCNLLINTMQNFRSLFLSVDKYTMVHIINTIMKFNCWRTLHT